MAYLEEIGKNMRRMSLISELSRKEILERGEKEFSKEEQEYINKIAYQISDIKQVYKFAGFNHSDGSPGKNIITSAVVSYYLNHPESLKPQ